MLALALVCGAPALAGCAAKAMEQRSGSAEQLYQLCGSCHGPDGGGRPEVNAPAIAGLTQTYVKSQLDKFRDGLRGGHFDDLAGMQMRPMAMSLTDTDVVTIAAYVSTLPVVAPAPTLQGGDAARGKALYAPCTACHGQKGEGSEQMKAPAVNHGSDWYFFTQLKHFKSGVRGANPLDTEGATMAPMAKILADEQAMKDVVAYMATLRPGK
jgi:cytochrome c oxidase subunit 2